MLSMPIRQTNIRRDGAVADIEVSLQTLVSRLVEEYQPLQVVLYGSLAWGSPDVDSDVDLLITKDTDETPLQRRVRVRQIAAKVGLRLPFSPLVLTPEELEQRLAMGDAFYQNILANGIILYERC
jgi:predicted nucleotidyltransferase